MTPIDFENNVLCLLNACKSESEKLQFEVPHRNWYFDAFTPTGIESLGLKANTYIEIKSSFRPDTLFLLRKYLDAKLNICLICDDNIHPKFQSLNGQIIILTRNDLEIISNNGSSIESFSPYDKARKIFTEGANAFILGAGVGMSAGLPSWDSLLEQCNTNTEGSISQHETDTFSDIQEICGHSSIIESSYITLATCSKKNDIIDRIVKTLRQTRRNESPILNHLCEHIKEKRVDEVLTFNYDDLIENRLDSIGFRDYYSVFEGNRQIGKYIPIYHLHGMIPLDKKIRDIESTPIITEQQYHRLYKEPYYWANIALLHALNNKTCFFIGLSMSDPNLRRLLDYYSTEDGFEGKKELLRHYVFLCREDATKTKDHKCQEKRCKVLEKRYAEMGLEVIWYNDHEKDLPDMIANLSK